MKILLLEDDEGLALGIEFTLKKEGFDLIRAGTGYDVCKYIREKSEILKSGDIELNTKTAKVTIKRMREKIEDDIRYPKYISTIRGIGYK